MSTLKKEEYKLSALRKAYSNWIKLTYNSKSKEVFERIKQCCESACLGLGQSPYNRFLQSITPCREDLEVLQQELDRFEQLEKELKQTKLNFKNSQIHSKNCYKKLKEKYTRLERAYKNNEVMTRDLNELINRNLELKKDYELLDEDYDQLFEKFLESEKENQELKAKETPMKVDMKDNKKIKCDKKLITLVTYYKCPNKKCEFHNNYKILIDEKRCPECNQKLDWSDDCE